MKDLYTARVAVDGGRDGSATSSDGKLFVKLGLPSELGGAGDAVNPEQLFVAGYAACFASSVKGAAAAMKLPVSNVRVDGVSVLSLREDGSYLVSRVELRVHADGLDAAAGAVIEEAKRICAYSNATRGNVQSSVVFA